MDGLLNISFDEYTSIPVMLPRKDEQDRIAEYFKNLDHHITLHQRKLGRCMEMERSLLYTISISSLMKRPIGRTIYYNILQEGCVNGGTRIYN